MLFIVIFLLILSIFFFVFAHISRQQWDEGSASVHLTIGILLLVIDVVMFIILINAEHLYE